MEANSIPIGRPISNCMLHVLDRNMRQIYLGTDEAEARKLAVEGTTMRSATTMSDAMLTAALAYSTGHRR